MMISDREPCGVDNDQNSVFSISRCVGRPEAGARVGKDLRRKLRDFFSRIMAGRTILSTATTIFLSSSFEAPIAVAFVQPTPLNSRIFAVLHTARLDDNQSRAQARGLAVRRSQCSFHRVKRSAGISSTFSSQMTSMSVEQTNNPEPDQRVTELPDSFEDSIARMGKATLQAMNEGQKRLRIDFDTSAGDETYTMLKNSLEMTKQLTNIVAEALIVDGNNGEETPESTMAIFFPDAGSAALAKFEWGSDTEDAEVPSGVRFCTVKTEGPMDTDVGCIVLCPRNSEAEFVLELLKKVEARGQFMVLINPELINMGTTGYGLAGRRIRDEIVSTFHTSYYLRTLPWGAVTREHGKWYTVWQDDPEDPTGYRLLKTTTERPVGETLDDIYNIANGLQGEDEAPEFLGSLAKFVRDFRAM